MNIKLKDVQGNYVLHQNVDYIQVRDENDEFHNIEVNPVYAEKTIVEEGIYQASEDGARAYTKVIVDLGAEDPLVAELPESFAAAKYIYNFKLNASEYLLSADVEVGVWLYNIITKALTQIIDYGAWNQFVLADNDTCLIALSTGSTSTAKGVWKYTISTQTIDLMHSTGNWNYFQKVGTKWLIGGGNTNVDTGILSYDTLTGTRKIISSIGANWSQFCVLGDKCLVSSTSNNVNLRGLYLYNSVTDAFDKIWEEGYNYSNFIVLPNNDCLVSASSSSYFTGLLLFKYSEDTAERVLDTGYAYSRYKIIGDNCLVASNTNIQGLYLYVGSTKQVVPLHTTGTYWWYYTMVDENCCLIRANGSNTGMLLYDNTTLTTIPVYTLGGYYKYIHKVDDTHYLLVADNTATKGVYEYNHANRTVTQVHSTFTPGSYYVSFQNVFEGCLIAGKTPTGVYLYSLIDSTCTQLYTSSQGWDTFKLIGDNCIITSTATSNTVGALLYKGDSKTISKLITSGYVLQNFIILNDKCIITSTNTENTSNKGVWVYDNAQLKATQVFAFGYYDTFEIVGNTCRMSHSNKKVSPYTLEYDADTNTISFVKYYLGGN